MKKVVLSAPVPDHCGHACAEQAEIHRIASAAMEAMLFEVSATPKPGLVDRTNCGAHRDMDYFTFMSSASALYSCFDSMVRLGVECRQQPVRNLLPLLRKCGAAEEEKMFASTNGINTHKGMIFTLGLLCGCAGWCAGKGKFSWEQLCFTTAEMCEGMCEKEFSDLHGKENLTKGEQMYLKYGCKGVRGEVESAYETIRKISMPVYCDLRRKNVSVNDTLVQTLLYLIAGTIDTNILSRHDWQTSQFAREYAKKVISQGGILTREGCKTIEEMDQVFIRKYISPGGCADLLAVTHFLYTLSDKK